jgi:hypothetical protein
VIIGSSIVVVLLVLVVILDRVTVGVAERAAETRLAKFAQFGKRPTVRIHGIPFLTQALGGKYSDIEVSGQDVHLSQVAGASIDVDLHGVHLPLRDLRSHNVTEVPVDRVEGTVTVPYAELARLSRVPGLTITPGDGTVGVSANLPVPGVGGLAKVTGQGSLTLVDGSVRLSVTGLRVAGVAVPGLALQQLTRALSASIAVPTLPFGLRLTSIDARHNGLVIRGAGKHVVLRQVQQLPT